MQSCSGSRDWPHLMPEGDFIPFRNISGRVSNPSAFMSLSEPHSSLFHLKGLQAPSKCSGTGYNPVPAKCRARSASICSGSGQSPGAGDFQRAIWIGRRPFPVFGPFHISLAHGVFVNVVQFLQEKAFVLDDLGLIVLLPKSKLPFLIHEQRQEIRFMTAHGFMDALRREALEVTQTGGGVRSADDEMEMVEHEDETEDFQTAPLLQEAQTVREDLPAIMMVENVIPVPHRGRDEIGGGCGILRNVRNGHDESGVASLDCSFVAGNGRG